MATQQGTLADATPQLNESTPIEYRLVPGFPGYRVGTDGSIWTSLTKNAAKGPRIPGGMWRQIRVSRCYARIDLYCDGRLSSLSIHRIVLLAFIGPPAPGQIACHNNGNPADNRLENLRWGTYKDNSEDAKKHGTRAVGERVGGAKLTTRKVREIVNMLDRGESQANIAAIYGVSKHTIHLIDKGKVWAWLTNRVKPATKSIASHAADVLAEFGVSSVESVDVEILDRIADRAGVVGVSRRKNVCHSMSVSSLFDVTKKMVRRYRSAGLVRVFTLSQVLVRKVEQ